MRKRTRKKKRLGEFQESGFTVMLTFKEGADHDFHIHDEFIGFLESCQPKLAIGGGIGDKSTWEFIVVREQKYAATYDGDRTKVFNWAVEHPEIISVKGSNSYDTWYDEDGWYDWDEKFCFPKENA